MLAEHPERDAMKAERYAQSGTIRKYPVMLIGHLNDPDDKTVPSPKIALPEAAVPDDEIGRLARAVLNFLKPLEMDNPVRQILIEAVGKERFDEKNSKRICECSVNLMSADMYVEHVLPYDKKIQDAVGRVHIHPCSGPHVFKATLDNLDAFWTDTGLKNTPTANGIETVHGCPR